MEKYLKEINQILSEFHIKNGEDYLNKTAEELSEIYENIKIVQEEYDLTDDKIEEVLESIFGEFEE